MRFFLQPGERGTNEAKVKDDVVTYATSDRIGIITINLEEKLNALTGDAVAGIRNSLIQRNESDDPCAIIHGAGDRAISVGANLKRSVARPGFVGVHARRRCGRGQAASLDIAPVRAGIA
jgi:enoyl-CoA hydratase/carnithine racemase